MSAGGVLLVKGDAVAQGVHQGLLEALGSLVQGGVLHQLADTYGVALGFFGGSLFSGGLSGVFGGGLSGGGLGAAAGGQGEDHCCDAQQGK